MSSYPEHDARRSDVGLQSLVAETGERLRNAISSLLDELASAGMKDQRDLKTALNLSQSATSRLVSCVRVTDPLATLSRVPGPQGLRKMLKGASRAGVNRECLANMDDAIRGVESLINDTVGDRDSLDSILSDWVHESRPSYELKQKYTAYKAMCAIVGVQARVHATCVLVHPSDDPQAYDMVEIEALYGCRRVRPNASLDTLTRHLAPEPHRFEVTSLDNKPIKSFHDIVLRDFSTVNLESVETLHHGTTTHKIFHDLPLGKCAGADVISAQLARRKGRAFRGKDDSPTTGVACHSEPPSADMVFDVLLHEEVWRDCKPELRMFDTVVRGLAHPDDPARQADRIEMLESIVFLGRHISAFRVAEIPRYTEMIEHVCKKLSWNPQEFRGYRCKIRYPVYGSQICMAFTPPAGP